MTLEQLQERLEAEPWRHTYSGIPVWESDDGERLLTIGHVNKAAFVKACDAYYEDVNGERLTDRADTPAAVLAADTLHRRARIGGLDEFPAGEFKVDLDEGDVPVTVLAVY